ncbi:hypothetical protein ADK65_29985 [Streptomyces sp. NRRL B-1140]|nr:hypothetical protein ADK65_29985 [Streptomyces sp. NRRL B-1140]
MSGSVGFPPCAVAPESPLMPEGPYAAMTWPLGVAGAVDHHDVVALSEGERLGRARRVVHGVRVLEDLDDPTMSSQTLLIRFCARSSFVYLGMRPSGSHPLCGLSTYATGFGAGARPRGSGEV